MGRKAIAEKFASVTELGNKYFNEILEIYF